MKVLEGKDIYISSQSDPWKYLHRMVGIMYTWHSFSFHDQLPDDMPSCLKLK